MNPTREKLRFDLGAREARRALWVIVGVGFVLFVVALGWGLPSWRGWAPDEIEPQTVLEGLELGFAGQWTTRYPPLHYYLLVGAYAPVRFFAGTSLVASDPARLNYLLFLSGRWLSVLLATATLWLAYRTARVFQDRFASCLVAATAAVMVPLVYYSKTVNLEAPYLFWFALSLLLFLRILRRHRLSDYLGFAVAAACAVGTKDQAYALYVLPVLLLPGFLAAHRRLQEDRPGGAVSALFDRRVLWSLVVGVGLLAAIHKLPFDLDGFRHHLEEMRRVASPAAEYEASVGGHVALALAGVRLSGFILGLPLLVAALGGAAAAALDLRRNWRPLTLLAFVVSYHLFFIAVVRYSYDRFYLPVALVLAFFAGPGLAGLLRWRRVPSAAAWIVLVGVFGCALLRAASVDALMLADSRYAAEEWLEAELQPGEVAVAAGRSVKLHPRGLEHMVWRDRTHRSVAQWLHDNDARFLVLHPEDPWTTSDLAIRRRLLLGDLNFRPAAAVRGEPAIDLLRLEGVRTNLTKVNAEMMIAERSEPWGAAVTDVLSRATDALESSDPGSVARVAEEIATTAIPDRRQLLGELAVSLGGERHQPIREGAPAAILVTNPSDRELSIDLRLGLEVEGPDRRAAIRLLGGETTETLVVGGDSETIARLGPVGAGERRLFGLLGEGPHGVLLKPPLRRQLADGVWATGLTADLSTEGAPVVIAIDNPTADPRRVGLLLAASTDLGEPLFVRLDGLDFGDTVELPPRTRFPVSLPAAPPYGRLALVMTATGIESPSGPRRGKGLRIVLRPDGGS